MSRSVTSDITNHLESILIVHISDSHLIIPCSIGPISQRQMIDCFYEQFITIHLWTLFTTT